jgi:hypothetical protein
MGAIAETADLGSQRSDKRRTKENAKLMTKVEN